MTCICSTVFFFFFFFLFFSFFFFVLVVEVVIALVSENYYFRCSVAFPTTGAILSTTFLSFLLFCFVHYVYKHMRMHLHILSVFIYS